MNFPGRFFAVVMIVLISATALADDFRDREESFEANPQWRNFESFVQERRASDEELGLSYMISGGIATVGGTYGFYAAEEVFSRGVFAVTSALGIAAIGMGATYYWTGNEYDSLYYALKNSSLTTMQRNQILARYIEKERIEREHRRWIRVATHALIAAVNFYSASQETSSDAKTVFYFLGGINTVIAISLSF